MTDIYGGPGTGTDIGFNNSGTIGSATITKLISISAGSLGTGSSEIGISNNGTIQVSDGGTITLNGTGGGSYNNGLGATNYGIQLSGGAISAGLSTGSGVNTINITGIGGTGGAGQHHGVIISAATAFNLPEPISTTLSTSTTAPAAAAAMGLPRKGTSGSTSQRTTLRSMER